ncbi:MAG TPA: HAMP domain-containing sensor histidine kinase [Burkholderiaceae bacterium]|nr:HAMP domain-containing sensor histidine kinase [Burkholderiaceae bacterium]
MLAEDLFGSLPADRTPSWRTLEYIALIRVLIVSTLVLVIAAFGPPLGEAGAAGAPRLLAVGLAYFVFAASLAILALFVRSNFALQLGAQLAIDLIMISILLALGGGVRGGIMIFYLLPLASAALLLPTIAAFFVCSLAVLVLLIDSLLRGLQPGVQESVVFQAGLYGAALFAITGLLGLLSARLSVQERLATRRGRDLENQLEINRLVIAQIDQGVLVVDGETRVRANNRAARLLLSLHPEAQFTGRRLDGYPHMQPLAQAFTEWLVDENPRGNWFDAVLTVAEDGAGGAAPAAEVRLRARFARPTSDANDEFVIFLEDVRAIEQRAQQLKLASMGRLTASIAHEIRNPLAAISHAGQLLAEEADAQLQRRLVAIVRENTLRLNRLVEDVLRVARREPPLGDEIALGRFVGDWLQEFERDRGLPAGRVRVEARSDLVVKFEPSHLRQILFNLIDNALRYATSSPGAVEVVSEVAADDGGRPQLWVFDDGPGVAAETRAALFEPFYTTHARGTGLGLYIAREFALANGCDLAFGARRDLDGTSREGFVLRFARTSGAGAETGGFLDTMPVH